MNAGLRDACADILAGLAGQRDRDPRSAGRLLHGARMLRHAELLTYGPPVPGDEVQALIDEALSELRDELEGEAEREIEAEAAVRNKAFKAFEKAMVKFDDEREDIKAVLEAWDEYRRAVRS